MRRAVPVPPAPVLAPEVEELAHRRRQLLAEPERGHPSPTCVTMLRAFSFTKDGRVCSSQANLPAYAIESGVPSYLCIDPGGGKREHAALAARAEEEA